jgi:hypothetical protein
VVVSRYRAWFNTLWLTTGTTVTRCSKWPRVGQSTTTKPSTGTITIGTQGSKGPQVAAPEGATVCCTDRYVAPAPISNTAPQHAVLSSSVPSADRLVPLSNREVTIAKKLKEMPKLIADHKAVWLIVAECLVLHHNGCTRVLQSTDSLYHVLCVTLLLLCLCTETNDRHCKSKRRSSRASKCCIRSRSRSTRRAHEARSTMHNKPSGKHVVIDKREARRVALNRFARLE